MVDKKKEMMMEKKMGKNMPDKGNPFSKTSAKKSGKKKTNPFAKKK